MAITLQRRRVVAAVLLLAIAGCRQEGLVTLLDADSARRLEAIPPADGALVAVRLEPSPAETPALPAGARLVDRAGGTLLVDAPLASLEDLAALPGAASATVWGASDVLRKLEPRLRGDLLAALDAPDDATRRHAMIATLAPAATGVEEAVTACGGRLRTLVGDVATLEADTDAVLRLLELPDLRQLARPTTLRPLEAR